jgi:hypothetical protein
MRPPAFPGDPRRRPRPKAFRGIQPTSTFRLLLFLVLTVGVIVWLLRRAGS